MITEKETFIMDLGKVDIETEKASAGATTGRKAWFPEAPKAAKE